MEFCPYSLNSISSIPFPCFILTTQDSNKILQVFLIVVGSLWHLCDVEWSLSISSRTDLGTSFSYKVTNPLDYGNSMEKGQTSSVKFHILNLQPCLLPSIPKYKMEKRGILFITECVFIHSRHHPILKKLHRFP